MSVSKAKRSRAAREAAIAHQNSAALSPCSARPASAKGSGWSATAIVQLSASAQPMTAAETSLAPSGKRSAEKWFFVDQI